MTRLLRKYQVHVAVAVLVALFALPLIASLFVRPQFRLTDLADRSGSTAQLRSDDARLQLRALVTLHFSGPGITTEELDALLETLCAGGIDEANLRMAREVLVIARQKSEAALVDRLMMFGHDRTCDERGARVLAEALVAIDRRYTHSLEVDPESGTLVSVSRESIMQLFSTRRSR